VTAPLPALERQPGLSFAARRWLLGAEAQFDGETGAVFNAGIVRWRHLIVRKPDPEEWRRFLAEFWAEHRDRIVEHHVRRHPGTRPVRWWPYDAPDPRRQGESERAYLRRHKILRPGELKRASGRPSPPAKASS
jgi:hypothetical protein